VDLDAWIRANVSGIVLNGGDSQRLGRDKALLRIGGRALIERALDPLAALFDEVLVVGRPEAVPEHPAVTRAVRDVVAGVGPLGGICTGLQAMGRPLGFVVACDMPWLDAPVIRRQLAVLRETGADAVVPRWEGYWEPLHAAYSRACLPVAEARIAARDFRIRSFFEEVRVHFWDVAAEGLSTRPFTNVNTKGDLAAVVEQGGEACQTPDARCQTEEAEG
jgi:molybdopterin-guanine dinucleotide biosynthesis protein A